MELQHQTNASHARRRWFAATATLAVLGVVVLVANATGVLPTSGGLGRVWNEWTTTALQLLAATVLGARAIRHRSERAAWTFMAIGVATYAIGMFIWTTRYAALDEPPFPSPSDAFWLAFYPLAIAAFIQLTRGRLRWRRPGPILDGLIGALAAATIFSALILEAVINTLGGGGLGVAVNLAYPIFDLILLAFVIGHISSSQWHLSRRWTMLSAGLVVFVIADGAYTYSVAKGDLDLGTLVNTGYSVGLLLVAFSVWGGDRDAGAEPRWEELRVVLPSLVLGFVAVAALVANDMLALGPWTVGLAAMTLVVALVRTGMSFHENLRLLDARRDSLQDELTGLANRRMFLRALTDAIDDARSTDGHVGLLLIDLDRFKDINDSLGHQVGDELLRTIAARLTTTLRYGELVARLGGDEFCVLVNSCETTEQMRALAQRLLAALNRPVPTEQMVLNVGASIGVAVFPEHGESASDLLRASDIAMYRAKGTGGEEVSVFDPLQPGDGTDQLALMGQVRSAIERGEFEVHYQPRFNTGTGALTTVEALVRWRHPELGVLSPAAFLPGIERTALIGPLTDFVLETALADVVDWRRSQPDIAVAVNVSARLLHDAELSKRILAALQNNDAPPQALELEITETLLMTDPARASDLLRELVALGVKIAVDDFGVGHASLAYLTDLPVSILKIDRSFIHRMGRSDRDLAVVATIVQLADQLGMVSVAEGIEEDVTLRQVSSLGCREVQGFLLARPKPAKDVTQMIADRGAGALVETLAGG